MGWTGLAVEPLPEAYKKLVNNRKCITINGCISPETGKRTFRVISGYAQMLSGLVDEYHPKHIKRIERELGLHGGKYNDIEINCYNLNELLKKYSIFYLDYLSIDIEGSEYKILDNIDFTRIYISVISVENKYSDYRIPRLLIDNGFRFHSKAGDEFYINKKSHK
jgi:FkbM family methyltransferase